MLSRLHPIARAAWPQRQTCRDPRAALPRLQTCQDLEVVWPQHRTCQGRGVALLLLRICRGRSVLNAFSYSPSPSLWGWVFCGLPAETSSEFFILLAREFLAIDSIEERDSHRNPLFNFFDTDKHDASWVRWLECWIVSILKITPYPFSVQNLDIELNFG